jgi:hypothetical protein
MIRSLVLFCVLFAIALLSFSYLEYDKVSLKSAIEEFPAYAVLTPGEMTSKTKKGRTTYQVHYTYRVAGTMYEFNSPYVSEWEAKKFVSSNDTQLAFVAGAPERAMLKTEFEHRKRQSDQTFAGVLRGAFSFAAIFALIATAVVIYRFSWFRRTD